MGKDPATLWYWADWSGGTCAMSRLHKGAYMDLLNAQFNLGHLTLEQVKTILGSDFDSCWEALKEKFRQDENSRFYNEKAENEKIKRANYTQSRRDNLEKKVKLMEGHMEPHIVNANINANTNVITNEVSSTIVVWPTFDDFWNVYDKKVDKPKCQKRWDRLNQKQKEAIMDHLGKYIPSTPDKAFRKDPATYLNNSSWENEIVKNGESKHQPTREDRNRYFESKFGSKG